MAFKKILAATDFSVPAQRAMQRAALLAKQTGAQLRLIHAVPEPGWFEQLLHGGEVTHAAMFRGAEKTLHAACQALELQHGIDATWAVVIGNAHRAILEAAETFDAELLVVGTRGVGESPFRNSSLGGTAVKLLAHCATPLLLVRRPAEGRYRRLAGPFSAQIPELSSVALRVAFEAPCDVLQVP